MCPSCTRGLTWSWNSYRTSDWVGRPCMPYSICWGENRTIAGAMSWKFWYSLSGLPMVCLTTWCHRFLVFPGPPSIELSTRLPSLLVTICTISFPSPANLDNVGQLSGTPIPNKAVGAIDGCHIRIKPPSLHRLDYLNYQGFYSINIEAICDSSGEFLDIYVGYQGCVHDTCILKSSSFYTARRYPPNGYFILGDGGFLCLETPIFLITPYREPVNGRVQRKFNYHQSKGCSIVERAFGIMKACIHFSRPWTYICTTSYSILCFFA